MGVQGSTRIARRAGMLHLRVVAIDGSVDKDELPEERVRRPCLS